MTVSSPLPERMVQRPDATARVASGAAQARPNASFTATLLQMEATWSRAFAAARDHGSQLPSGRNQLSTPRSHPAAHDTVAPAGAPYSIEAAEQYTDKAPDSFVGRQEMSARSEPPGATDRPLRPLAARVVPSTLGAHPVLHGVNAQAEAAAVSDKWSPSPAQSRIGGQPLKATSSEHADVRPSSAPGISPLPQTPTVVFQARPVLSRPKDPTSSEQLGLNSSSRNSLTEPLAATTHASVQVTATPGGLAVSIWAPWRGAELTAVQRQMLDRELARFGCRVAQLHVNGMRQPHQPTNKFTQE